MAKELCTIENNDIGRIARRYFILMEKIVKENKEWLAIRDPEKDEYKKMSVEVNAWYGRVFGRKTNRIEFAAEADMLNLIVTGKTSRELKNKLHIETNDLLRDYLKKEHNEELLFLEQQNQILLRMDMSFDDRKKWLSQMYTAKFKKKNIQVV